MPLTYDPIASQVLTVTTSSVVFSNIPNTYTDLRLLVSSLVTADATEKQANIRVNGDAGTNYSLTWFDATGTVVASGRTTNQTGTAIYYSPTTSITTQPLFSTVDIFSYANTNVNKTWLANGYTPLQVNRYVSLWRSNAAINSITVYIPFGNSFLAGSSFELYGIKAA